MKPVLTLASATLALCLFAAAPAHAVDLEYFKAQSCTDLDKELDALTKAEKAINDAKKKNDSAANVKSAVGFLLTGWPFWGSADHGDSDAQLKEIRDDAKLVKGARKINKCG